ncbi:MAG: bifunctional 5,10-methylenetetrahydrofolate dehydrogenase/5,10-methenyltetrahydrofolate cyclohydrolase [bacterium]|nr:bifunctional 5,10-methylenetetrahydrofolate dehydrogenase/5,10-methenyltetrahydrofolate cyclohydrolase [bacterium]
MTIFDGLQLAAEKEIAIKARVDALLQAGRKICIAAILFEEDAGSRLYTRLKQEAAARVGMEYQVYTFSMNDSLQLVLSQLQLLNTDRRVTGIIIQKPSKQKWEEIVTTMGGGPTFAEWWQSLVSHIELRKDVDGLHPVTLQAIVDGRRAEQGLVMPATAKAVITILEQAELIRADATYIILGRSDILGKPLWHELLHRGLQAEMIGSAELRHRKELGLGLKDATVIITATGRPGLITGDLLLPGAAVIDVGEPKPDVDRESVEPVAGFLTPVPGGVGPVTVVSLLENALDLVESVV